MSQCRKIIRRQCKDALVIAVASDLERRLSFIVYNLNFTHENRIFYGIFLRAHLIDGTQPDFVLSLFSNSVEQTGIKRLYYSISEVSNLVDEEQYVLRYWETEFEQLRPQKNRAGNRIYNEKDIQIIRTIQQLLRIKRFTIDGAKEHLKTVQFDTKTLAESLPEEEHLTEISRNGLVNSEPTSDTAELLSIAELNNTTESNEIAESNGEITTTTLLQHSEINPPPTLTIEAETPPAETAPFANGEAYSFSRTMQAEWYAPTTINTAARLSIPTLVPDALHDGEIALASEETVRSEAISNVILQEQAQTEQPLPMAEPTTTANAVLPSETNNRVAPEARPSAAFSRAELLDLRDALRQVLRLLEPTQINDSLPTPDTTETTI